MKILDMFKEPIDKKDLLSVIKQAAFMTIIGGLLIGAINLLVDQIFHSSFELLFLFIFGMTLAQRMHAYYKQFHIIYAIVAVISVIVTYYLVHSVFNAGIVFMVGYPFREYLLFIFNPIDHFSFLYIFSSGFFTVANIVDLFFFIVINIYVVINLK